jgi:hypothetical protein
MTTIKKGFQEVYSILIANKDKKVSTIIEELTVIMESQQRDKNHFEDDDGLHVFCYYHKQWELTSQVEYGRKVNTATGLNSMCKVGTNQWTKQQREFKKFRSELLDLVSTGELAVSDIDAKTEELEVQKDRIITLYDHHHTEALLDPRQLETDK